MAEPLHRALSRIRSAVLDDEQLSVPWPRDAAADSPTRGGAASS